MAERGDEGLTRDAAGYTPDPSNSSADRPDNDLGATALGSSAPYPGMPDTARTWEPDRDDASEDRSRVYQDRPLDEKSPAEIERDIRRTRAELSETVDAMARKLSPDNLKHELKESMHEGIDYLRDRYNPRRIAKNTGQSMLDTIKANPLPSLIAGLSIGWLFMKGNENDDRRRWDDGSYRGERDFNRGAYGRDYRRGMYQSEYGSSYSEDYFQPPYYGQSEYAEREDHDSLKHRVSEKAGEIRHKASEVTGDLRHRAGEVTDDLRQRTSEIADTTQQRVQDLGRGVRRQTRRTVGGLEHFVYENPLAAGALALGIGALLGTVLPSTEREDELMGETRDRLVHQARDVAEQTIEQSKPIAQRVVDEAKDAAREVADKVKSEAQNVVSSAKEGARDVKNEAKTQIRERA